MSLWAHIFSPPHLLVTFLLPGIDGSFECPGAEVCNIVSSQGWADKWDWEPTWTPEGQ